MVNLNLRGQALSTAQTLLVVAPCFILFGYSQAGIGGLLSVSLFFLRILDPKFWLIKGSFQVGHLRFQLLILLIHLAQQRAKMPRFKAL